LVSKKSEHFFLDPPASRKSASHIFSDNYSHNILGLSGTFRRNQMCTICRSCNFGRKTWM